jgi:hypothetical protein
VSEVSTIDLNIAKLVFQVDEADASGLVVFRRRIVGADLMRGRAFQNRDIGVGRVAQKTVLAVAPLAPR